MGNADVGSIEELARSVRVVVEAGAVGSVPLTREGAARRQGNARIGGNLCYFTNNQRLFHGTYR